MKNIFAKLFLVIAAGFFCNRLNAQTKELDNVIEVKLQNTVTIKNNNTIVGYAFFYKVDEMKKAAMYRLEILDENLKTIGSNEFEGSKVLQLQNAVYESEHILLAFYDEKKTDGYKKFVRVFNLKGKETGLVPYDPEKVKKGMYGEYMADIMGSYYNGYNNIEGKGFVVVYQSAAKTGGADIQMIDKLGKLKWEKSLTAEKGERLDMYLAAATPNALVFFAINRDGITAKDSKNFLIGINPDNGAELYKKPMEIDKYAWEPMLFKTNKDNQMKLISTLTHEEDKFFSARPVGFNIASFDDKTGDIKLEKNYLFETELSKVMEMKNESKSEDGFVKIHDVCLMADGSKVVVGEFFRRTVNGVGVAFKILSRGGGSGSVTQASIGNMFLLRIDNKNNIVSLDKIEKEVDRVSVYDGLSIGLMSRMLSMEGAFGYLYTDEDAETNKRTVIADGTFDGETYGTNAITFDEGKGFKQKKFTIEKEKKDRVYLRKGKPGHLLVMKYNAKQKKISLNLERVN
jgi:hypothetical protein